MDFFQMHPKLERPALEAEQSLVSAFTEIESVTEYNQRKVLYAFQQNRVGESHFAASTGYGYDDRGRETLDRVFADVAGAEDALFRSGFVSGTHALTVALFGVLRPGDRMLCVTGRPYETLIGVLGIDGASSGSLADFGIRYEQLELTPSGGVDLAALEEALHQNKYRVVYLQRSRGYSLRPALSCEGIGEAARLVHKISPGAAVMVDNCYGEFVERREPAELGADLIIGSLIKNPGGGIAPTGGYIAGRAGLVELCAYRLTAPQVGREVGATLGHNRELFMGLFSAPHVVGEALKTAAFASALFERMGFPVSPAPADARADIVQCIRLGSEDALLAFCAGIQRGAPVNAFARPEPAAMPGYDCQIVMAAGAFTLGASIELSADAPLREPYAVWLQGGLNYHSGKVGVLQAAQAMWEAGCLKLGE